MISLRRLFVEAHVLEGFLQLVNQFGGDPGEIVDEIERVLDLVRDAGGQLTERGELLRLHQAVLRGAQVLQRLCQVARAGLNTLEQPRVLDRHHRLVCKGLQQLDRRLWELAWRLAPDDQRADDVVRAQKGNDQDAAIAFAQDDLVDRRGLVANVRDLDWFEGEGKTEIRKSAAACSGQSEQQWAQTA